MPGATPVYGFPYALLGESPHGPNQGLAAAAAFEAALQNTDANVAALTLTRARGCVARGSRATNSPGATVDNTDVAVLRVSAPVVSGRLYFVTTSPLALDSTVTNDEIGARIRFNTAGNATTASTILPGSNVSARQTDGNVPEHRTIVARYLAGATGTVSFLLCVRRIAGTGTCIIAVDGTAGDVIDLNVDDSGVDPGDTGVDL